MPKSKIIPQPKTDETPPAPRRKSPRPATKFAAIVDKLRSPDGITVKEIQALTGWQEHSVRGALAGVLKTRFNLVITSEKLDRGRVYRAADADAQP